jgi:hypothetical protein
MPTVLSIIPERRGSAPILVTTTELNRGYFPRLGLPCSLLVHGIAAAAMLFSPLFQTVPTPPVPQFAPRDRPSERIVAVMYLPAISPGGAQTAGTVDAPPKVAPAAPAAPPPRTQGLVYPGPQEIVSDFPEPTNRTQTLLQPDLKNLPVVEPPLALPNFVEIAAPAFVAPPRSLNLASRPDPVEFQEEPPPTQPSVQDTVRAEPEPTPPQPISDLTLHVPIDLPVSRVQAPQFTVAPPPAPTVPVRQTEAVPPVPETEPAAPTRQEPPPVDYSPLPAQGTGRQNVLALSPMPAMGDRPAQLPAAEARGRFAISPEPNLAAPETEPGAATAPPPPEAPPAVINLSPTAPNPSQNQVTISFGPSVKTDLPGGSAGAGAGATGLPTGSGEGTGGAGGSAGSNGSAGSGGASGAGNAPFAGITIVGGSGWTGSTPKVAQPPPALRPLQTSYGLFVVSTERSGGGLPFFGVFGNQQVYTVFLDVRETELEQDPSWTLEFALDEEKASYVEVADEPHEGKHGLVLPFPMTKERPVLPRQVVRKHAGKMVIVYGVVNLKGKMEQMSVKETPDALLNQPLLDALSKWEFRPALLDGRPVVMKALLGVRLWSPQ